MTTLESTKKEAQNLIANNELRDCLEYLKNNLSEDSNVYSDLILLFGRFNEIEKNERLFGENKETEKNKFRSAVLDTINALKAKDIKSSAFVETLLIICNTDKRQDMEIFFGKKYFPNAEFINYGEPIPGGVYDVIFLEDETGIINQIEDVPEIGKRSTTENENRRTEMKKFIEANPKQYFIYIGKYFSLGYEDRVYFSNSRFSIYARLKEMLDYKKYYGH